MAKSKRRTVKQELLDITTEICRREKSFAAHREPSNVVEWNDNDKYSPGLAIRAGFDRALALGGAVAVWSEMEAGDESSVASIRVDLKWPNNIFKDDPFAGYILECFRQYPRTDQSSDSLPTLHNLGNLAIGGQLIRIGNE